MRNVRAWSIAATAGMIVFIVDRITKGIVRDHIAPGDSIDLAPGLDLVHTTNRGIAFGLFPGHQGLVATFTALALCVIAVVLVRAGGRALPVMIGGGMLVGGALGNLVDRLTNDGVTDFIAVTSHWPPFNVADMGIVCGGIIAAATISGVGAGRA